MDANIFEKTNHIIKACDAAYLGVIDENGCPSVSTVTPLNPEDIFEIYFSTGTDANKTKRLLKDNRASVCIRAGYNNITLVGEAAILTDQPTKSRFWSGWLIDHFSGGETDPAYCIIKFTTKRISLWVDNESAEFTTDELLTVQSRCGLLCKWCPYKESHGCGGCVETNGNPFHGECPIAVCCQDKGYAHCGECPDIPCDKLRAYSYDDLEHGDNPPGSRISVCQAWVKKNGKCGKL